MTGSKKLVLGALLAIVAAISGCVYRQAAFAAGSAHRSAAKYPLVMSEVVVTAEPLVLAPGPAVAKQSPANPGSPLAGLIPVYE